MPKLTITAEFEVTDRMSEEYGPKGVLEALVELGLYDVDIEVEQG
jgi:hypothetical protein